MFMFYCKSHTVRTANIGAWSSWLWPTYQDLSELSKLHLIGCAHLHPLLGGVLCWSLHSRSAVDGTMHRAEWGEAAPLKKVCSAIRKAAISIYDDTNSCWLPDRSCSLIIFPLGERGNAAKWRRLWRAGFISLTWQQCRGVLLGDRIYILPCNLVSLSASPPTLPPTFAFPCDTPKLLSQ